VLHWSTATRKAEHPAEEQGRKQKHVQTVLGVLEADADDAEALSVSYEGQRKAWKALIFIT